MYSSRAVKPQTSSHIKPSASRHYFVCSLVVFKKKVTIFLLEDDLISEAFLYFPSICMDVKISKLQKQLQAFIGYSFAAFARIYHSS